MSVPSTKVHPSEYGLYMTLVLVVTKAPLSSPKGGKKSLEPSASDDDQDRRQQRLPIN